MILRVPGDALLLRVAWIERHDLRTNRTADSTSPEKSSDGIFSSRRCRNLSKTAQFKVDSLGFPLAEKRVEGLSLPIAASLLPLRQPALVGLTSFWMPYQDPSACSAEFRSRLDK
jgi:hypothetical protein